MAPLTWLRLIGDPEKAIESLYHNNGCYPSVTQPNCMFVWNNPLQATKGKPRATLIPECIPGDLNTSPLALRQEHVVDKDNCIPPTCSVTSSHTDYSTTALKHYSWNVHRCNGLACRSALSGLSMHMRCTHMTCYDHTLALGWKIATFLQWNEAKLHLSRLLLLFLLLLPRSARYSSQAKVLYMTKWIGDFKVHRYSLEDYDVGLSIRGPVWAVMVYTVCNRIRGIWWTK